MSDRCYDTILECGCMYSADCGGGLMPCQYGTDLDTQEQTERCRKAHEEWYKTESYLQYKNDCHTNNCDDEDCTICEELLDIKVCPTCGGLGKV